MEKYDTTIIGAGLRQGRDLIVLEKDRLGEAWCSGKWAIEPRNVVAATAMTKKLRMGRFW